jgi:uncharacterized membrane protein YqjE
MNEPSPPGLSGSARQLAATLLDIVQARLQLAATELEEERLRLGRQLLFAACGLFFLAVGLVLACAWIVLACPPQQRLAALGGLTALFTGAGAAGLWRWQHLAARKPPLLHATLGELQNDLAALRPGAVPPPGDPS